MYNNCVVGVYLQIKNDPHLAMTFLTTAFTKEMRKLSLHSLLVRSLLSMWETRVRTPAVAYL